LDLEAISKELVLPVCPTSWHSPLKTVEKTFKGLRICSLATMEQIKKHVCMTKISLKNTIDAMREVMERVIMNRIPLMEVEQEIVKEFLITLQRVKKLHLGKDFFHKRFESFRFKLK
jgi:hypothetical protein